MQEWRKIFDSAIGSATKGHSPRAFRATKDANDSSETSNSRFSSMRGKICRGRITLMSRAMPCAVTRPSTSGRVRS
jgi:hypothetical protein